MPLLQMVHNYLWAIQIFSSIWLDISQDSWNFNLHNCILIFDTEAVYL